jgi:hypothetical protein
MNSRLISSRISFGFIVGLVAGLSSVGHCQQTPAEQIRTVWDTTALKLSDFLRPDLAVVRTHPEPVHWQVTSRPVTSQPSQKDQSLWGLRFSGTVEVLYSSVGSNPGAVSNYQYSHWNVNPRYGTFSTLVGPGSQTSDAFSRPTVIFAPFNAVSGLTMTPDQDHASETAPFRCIPETWVKALPEAVDFYQKNPDLFQARNDPAQITRQIELVSGANPWLAVEATRLLVADGHAASVLTALKAGPLPEWRKDRVGGAIFIAILLGVDSESDQKEITAYLNERTLATNDKDELEMLALGAFGAYQGQKLDMWHGTYIMTAPASHIEFIYRCETTVLARAYAVNKTSNPDDYLGQLRMLHWPNLEITPGIYDSSDNVGKIKYFRQGASLGF